MSELINQEIEKEINGEILDVIQRLFKGVDQDLNAPEKRKLYVNGLKDVELYVGTDQPLEATALKIIETKNLLECTLDEATLTFLKEELFFYTDLFYSLVTSAIEMCAVRKADIQGSGSLKLLFDVMQVLMDSMRDIPELDNLRKVLRDLSDDYPDKPELQRRIGLLSAAESKDTCVYTVLPPKRMSEYTDLDILATLKQGYATAQVEGIPAGLAIDATGGEISVEDAAQLVRGTYIIHVSTVDALGGVTLNTLELPIGKDSQAVYTLTPFLKVTQYNNGDVLATVSDPDGAIVSAKLRNDDTTGQQLLPGGVALNSSNGQLTVGEKKLLVPGTYPLTIITTDGFGLETEHRIVLVFKGDNPSQYKVFAPIAITDYRNEQVLATVSDPDGPVADATVTGLPEGVMLDPPTGSIRVENATLLKEGTYKFTVRSVSITGTEKLCAVELTIGNGAPAVQYSISPPKKVHNYLTGDKIASVNANGLAIESVLLAGGTMPAGVILNPNGDIVISDSALLKAGNYSLIIQVKPANLEVSTHLVDLVFEPDYKAVYRVTYGKDVADYTDGEIIADVIDVDTVVSAQILEGSLPPGTSLNSVTGQIKVLKASSLVAGKYVLKINTTDAENGKTTSRIAIFFTGTEHEALYTVFPPRAADSYKEGDVLATVEDVDTGVVKAVVSRGALPFGVALNGANGTLFVSDPKQLLAGVFDNIFIKTFDGLGGTTETELTLTFLDDIEIGYQVYPAKVVTAYSNGDTLALLVSDNPDDIRSAMLAGGKLPAGSKLNAITGAITVNDNTLLQPGNYFVSLLVTDKNGGQNTLSFEIVLLDDLEATWQVMPPTQADLLTNGQLVAVPQDPNGNIISAALVSGTVPAGMTLSTLTGVITVTNQPAVIAGNYPLQISTTDAVGGVTVADIQIIILNSDTEAIYYVDPPKNIDAYVINEELAYVLDADGPIVNAVIIGGTIPPGTTLETNGTIRVTNLPALVPGLFSATIRTTDDDSYTTDSVVVIQMLDDTEAIYNIPPGVNQDFLQIGTLLASVTDSGAEVVTATLTGGSLISGTTLYINEDMTNGTPYQVGDIVVTDPSVIVPGSYSNIQIQTVDVAGGKTQFNLTINILPDNEAVYSIQFSRDLHSYRNEDLIAFPVDPDGAVIAAVLLSGSLHSGVNFDTANGRFTIIDRTVLTGGFRNLEVRTSDASGGQSRQFIGVDIKTLPNRQARGLYNYFIRRFPERLTELEVLFADRLTPAFSENIGYLNDAKSVADIVSADLQNASVDAAYWAGSKEEDIRVNFLNISAPVKDGILSTLTLIQSGPPPEELEAAYRDLSFRTALYNEIFVSMLDLACYRLNDITDDPGKPINVMFEQIGAQFSEVKNEESVVFVKDNILAIRSGIVPTHPILQSKLLQLAS